MHFNTLFTLTVGLCYFCTTVVALNTAPGAQVRITNNGFDYGVKIAVESLIKLVRDASIPNVDGHSKGFTYHLSSMKINHFGISEKSLRPIVNSGIAWKLGGIDVNLRGNFAYKYHHFFIKISDHGSFTVKAGGLSLYLLVKITDDTKSGRPVLTATQCNCHINDISVHFSGSKARWLYNLIAKLAKGKLKKIISKAVCEQANKAVNVDGNKALKKLKLSTRIARKFLLNYGLSGNPTCASKYFETHHKGEVFWATDLHEAPFPSPGFPPSANSSRMIYIWLSDYIPNTFSYAAFTHHYLHYNLTHNDLPPASRHYLDTTCKDSLKCIGGIIPQIGAKFPNCTVKIEINATHAPVASVTPSVIKLSGLGDAKFYAITPSGKTHYMLNLALTLSLGANVYVKEDTIKAHVNHLRLKFKVIKSNIGPVQGLILDTIAQLAINFYVKPKLNAIGAKGFNLPVTGVVRLKNPTLSLIKNAIVIASDVEYKKAKEEIKSPWMDEHSFEAVGYDQQSHNRL